MNNPYAPPTGPVFRQAPGDGKGKATASLVLGVLSIIAWIIPLFGIPMTITGLVLGIKGLGPQRRGTAITRIVLSTIFLILALLNAIVGAYLGATGQHPLMKPRVQSSAAIRSGDADQPARLLPG